MKPWEERMAVEDPRGDDDTGSPPILLYMWKAVMDPADYKVEKTLSCWEERLTVEVEKMKVRCYWELHGVHNDMRFLSVPKEVLDPDKPAVTLLLLKAD